MSRARRKRFAWERKQKRWIVLWVYSSKRGCSRKRRVSKPAAIFKEWPWEMAFTDPLFPRLSMTSPERRK